MRHSPASNAIGTAAIAACLIATAGAVEAQPAYPDKTIKIIVGFPAGGAPDITARLLADKLQTALGKPVIIENLLGAGGNIASSRAAKAEPDGYTLYLAGNGSMVINPSLFETLPYDPRKDLAPISLAVSWPNVLAVANGVPAKTVQELVALARATPDGLTYGHSGVGISTHLAAEQFKQMGGLAIRPVAYTSAIAVMPDVVAGRVNICFCAITSVMELAKDGKVRALAVTSLERSLIAPELPTMAESGFPGFHATAWFGLMAPAGTPQPIIDKLSGEAAKAIKAPDVTKKLNDQGIVPIGSTAAEMASVMKSDSAYWAKLINAIGLKLK
jgi:tripartite-type tricarboxylate transporter receptor subunit TctC